MRVLLQLAATLLGLAAVAAGASPFAGTWHAKINDLPGVEIGIKENNESVTGYIVFFLQKRGQDGKWRIEGERTELPLLVPKIDGSVLSFEVIHYTKHGGDKLGPNAKFKLELTGTDEARLVKVEDHSPDPLTLLRQK